MKLASMIIERLSELDCPLVTSLHTSSSTSARGGGGQQISADTDLMNSLLLESGDLRERLLDWCLHKDGQVNTSVRSWLAVTGTCPGEEDAFVEATMVKTRQLQVWVSIVDLLSNLEEGDRVDKYPGLVEQLAEAVAFGAQARGDNLDVMPLHLAREMKGGKKADAEEVIPSLRAVSSFLEEAKEKRREMGEDQDECGKLKTISSNSEGLEEAFTRMSKEIEDFNIKYQGELLPWLPILQSQPRDRPEIVKALQVAEKTEAFMEDSRRLATTAARLEQNKEEVARQVEGVVSSLLPALTPMPTSQNSMDSKQTQQNLTSACL